MKTTLDQALGQLAAANRKNSRALCWLEAEAAARTAGVTVHPDETDRWPDLERLERDIRAALAPDVLIVTRHAGLVAWLELRGVTGTVVTHADTETVRGKRVYGALPLHLAAEAAEVVVVDMPNLRPDQRGVDLTPDEMDAASATLATYQVIRR